MISLCEMKDELERVGQITILHWRVEIYLVLRVKSHAHSSALTIIFTEILVLKHTRMSIKYSSATGILIILWAQRRLQCRCGMKNTRSSFMISIT